MIKTNYLSTCVPTHKVIQNKNKYIAHNRPLRLGWLLVLILLKDGCLHLFLHRCPYDYKSFVVIRKCRVPILVGPQPLFMLSLDVVIV